MSLEKQVSSIADRLVKLMGKSPAVALGEKIAQNEAEAISQRNFMYIYGTVEGLELLRVARGNFYKF